MRDKTELISDIETAKQAESIINHPLFIASTSALRELTIEKFSSLGFGDTLEMQECNIRLNLIEELELNLSTMISNGNIAFATLEEIQTFEQEIKK